MTRRRAALWPILVISGVLAMTGCTTAAAHPAQPTHRAATLTSTAGQTDAAAAYTYAPPAQSGDEIARVVVDGPQTTAGATVTTLTATGSTSVLFGCTGQPTPMGYRVLVDGEQVVASDGMQCTGQGYKDTAVLGLEGSHRITLDVTGATGEATRAYAVLIRGN